MHRHRGRRRSPGSQLDRSYAVLNPLMVQFWTIFELILDSCLINFVVIVKPVKLNLGAIFEVNNQEELPIPTLLEHQVI